LTLSLEFRDDFKDYRRLLRLWHFPPQCSYVLTHEGLRFTNAHWPILTTHLALLRDYEFEFRARIETKNIGWIVRGTGPFGHLLPTFCIMFNVTVDGRFRPHMLNSNKPAQGPGAPYHLSPEQRVRMNTSDEGWFDPTTRVVGDTVTVLNEGRTVFEANFAEDPYRDAYEFPNKQGEVGFRCHPGEEAVMNYMAVRELEPVARGQPGYAESEDE